MKKILIILSTIILVSCAGGQTSLPATNGIETKPGTLVNETDRTYPGIVSESTYPMESETDIFNVDQPDNTVSGTGILTGTLLLNNRPVVDVNLFMAKTLTDSEGIEIIAEMDVLKSPRSFTNTSGEFTIVNIPPGRYALILDIAVKSFLLVYPETQDTILITIEADTSNDLGILDYSDLPIPNSYIR